MKEIVFYIMLVFFIGGLISVAMNILKYFKTDRERSKTHFYLFIFMFYFIYDLVKDKI